MTDVAERFSGYYTKHGRTFPWRAHPSPFRMAVAEVLLQKTRASAVVPAFEYLVRRFPSPQRLADADESDIERSIHHLGLSRKRASHLRRLGAALAERGVETLSDPSPSPPLPGLGTYGARAVACFAFGASTGIVDANVRRVLSRIFRIRHPKSARIAVLADAIAVSAADPKAANYGVLDLAATVCLPKPRCGTCPLADVCAYGLRHAPRTG